MQGESLHGDEVAEGWPRVGKDRLAKMSAKGYTNPAVRTESVV